MDDNMQISGADTMEKKLFEKKKWQLIQIW